MDWSSFGLVMLLSAAVLAAMHAATWAWSRAAHKLAVVDVVWGLGFVLVALVSAVVGSGDAVRRVVLLVLAGVWGLRLTWHLERRARGMGEDPRYTALYADKGPVETALRVFGLQGALQWIISLPIQASAAVESGSGSTARTILGAGMLVWGTGLFFEAVGDRQLTAFRADPANRGRILDTGLWAWTRHPNYVGDAAVWWGMWLVAASSLVPVVFALAISPALMTFFLRNVSGARLLEKSLSNKPGWAEYAAKTPYFFPRPPRPPR